MARGQLIGESLAIGASLRGVPMRLLGVSRVEPPPERLSPDQPRVWTFIGFEIDDADAPRLAALLASALQPDAPWYCNYATSDEMWVVFANATFHYSRADEAGRARAVAHARGLGIPEPQLDWHPASD